MAWYSGTYSCGHDGRINIIGPQKHRQWKIDNTFAGLCPECRKKALEEECVKKNVEAAEKSAEMELPELSGSEKQVAWANTLRLAFITKADEEADYIQRRLEGDKASSAIQELYDAVDYVLEVRKDARFWIDNRNSNLIRESVLEYRKHQKEICIPKEIKEEIRKEDMQCTVAPACEKRKPGVAVIKFDSVNSVLSAIYIKDPEFMDIVKGLGYKWSGIAWKKDITEYTGSVYDREAELGNKLLLSGFTVQFPDVESKEMAASGTYQSENDRWIMRNKKNQDFAICWVKKSDELYDAAKKLPGARWKDGRMMVKAEFYKEVKDFAETMGFSVSRAAQDEIRKREKESEFETVNVTPHVENVSTDEERIAKSLKSNGTIIEDLVDG